MGNIQRQRDIERRLSAIEEKLKINKYKWDWCCGDFVEFCQKVHGITEKAHYTEVGTRKPIFVFFGKQFSICPFCGAFF